MTSLLNRPRSMAIGAVARVRAHTGQQVRAEAADNRTDDISLGFNQRQRPVSFSLFLGFFRALSRVVGATHIESRDAQRVGPLVEDLTRHVTL